MVNQHHRDTLLNLLHLYPKTPHPVVYFLAGSLPGEALLHLRQLALLGMISRLSNSLLHRIAINAFNSRVKSWSWFHQVRDLCLMYQLPHPLTFLTTPLTKAQHKALTKKHVVSYWEVKLNDDASLLHSLKYFKPEYMSLTKPHPLLTSPGASPYEARVQTLFLSGRYRTELLS